MTEHDLEDGQLAYDAASQSLVEIVDSDLGTVADQKDAMQDLIRRSDGNRACGVEPETECVEVRYVGVDEGDKEYTMPVTRIKRSRQLVEAACALSREAGVADDVHEQFSQGKNAELGDYT